MTKYSKNFSEQLKLETLFVSVKKQTEIGKKPTEDDRYALFLIDNH